MSQNCLVKIVGMPNQVKFNVTSSVSTSTLRYASTIRSFEELLAALIASNLLTLPAWTDRSICDPFLTNASKGAEFKKLPLFGRLTSILNGQLSCTWHLLDS